MTDQDKPQGPTDPSDPSGAAARTHSDDRDPSGDRDRARAEQIENAETSLDEPSDGSGGE